MEANCFTILWWFLPYIDMNPPRVYTCPPSWALLPPPSPSHPSGLSQCTGPECSVSCSEPGLAICFTCGNIHEESWAPKNWCFWTVVLEKTLESPLDCKEIQPVHPKGDQSWVFIGRTNVEAETPILWPPHAKSWLIGKDPDAGRDWGQEEKGTTEDEIAGWHHQLNGHEFE